eukprot:2246989-Rhodomonas_salina.3
MANVQSDVRGMAIQGLRERPARDCRACLCGRLRAKQFDLRTDLKVPGCIRVGRVVCVLA